jgi:hypothetical protein
MQQEEPSARLKRKLYRIGKSAAYSVGGGIAMYGIAIFYPRPEEAERVSRVFMALGTLLTTYGIIMLATLMLRQTLATKLNFLFLMFVIPAWLFYIFKANFHG